jgi:hypothetical protein
MQLGNLKIGVENMKIGNTQVEGTWKKVGNILGGGGGGLTLKEIIKVGE